MNKPQTYKYQFMVLLYSRGGYIKGVLTPGQLMIPCYVPGVDGLGFDSLDALIVVIMILE